MIADKSEKFLRDLLQVKTDAEARALVKTSDRMFVRSLDQLAEDSPAATGRKLTAIEAFEAYGKDTLLNAISEGSTLLCESPDAAGKVLKDRRELLRLTVSQVALHAGLDKRIVEEAEKSKRLPIQNYERIARSLGLDDRYISARAVPVGNEIIAVRLRHIGEENARMTPSAVSAIAEAAWVATAQIRLEQELEIAPQDPGIQPSSNYGAPGYPAYKHGYFLAADARNHLALGTGRLTKFMRELCDDLLGIPLIQAELGEYLAGVTVQAGDRRAIVLNIGGRNRQVYIRRSTIAHELGHLLYDVENALRELHVDEFDELEKPAEQLPDHVEQRANAFAIEFLAPQEAVLNCFRSASDDPVGAVMDTFGISFTAARNQIWNASERSIDLQSLTTERREPDPSFEVGEAYTATYHPIRSLPASRAGRFSAVVLSAAEERLISWQTAAEYLCCDEQQLHNSADAIHDLFPFVFVNKHSQRRFFRRSHSPN